MRPIFINFGAGSEEYASDSVDFVVLVGLDELPVDVALDVARKDPVLVVGLLWVSFERILESPLPSLQPDVFLEGSLKSQNVSGDFFPVSSGNKIDIGLNIVDLSVRD